MLRSCHFSLFLLSASSVSICATKGSFLAVCCNLDVVVVTVILLLDVESVLLDMEADDVIAEVDVPHAMQIRVVAVSFFVEARRSNRLELGDSPAANASEGLLSRARSSCVARVSVRVGVSCRSCG